MKEKYKVSRVTFPFNQLFVVNGLPVVPWLSGNFLCYCNPIKFIIIIGNKNVNKMARFLSINMMNA